MYLGLIFLFSVGYLVGRKHQEHLFNRDLQELERQLRDRWNAQKGRKE